MFRDLGIAFAAVLILIYGLVVGLFQSLLTPLIIMAAIPFSLVGMPLDEAVIDAGAVRFWSHLIKERTYATLFVLVREQSGFRCRLGRRPTDTRCAED